MLYLFKNVGCFSEEKVDSIFDELKYFFFFVLILIVIRYFLFVKGNWMFYLFIVVLGEGRGIRISGFFVCWVKKNIDKE